MLNDVKSQSNYGVLHLYFILGLICTQDFLVFSVG